MDNNDFFELLKSNDILKKSIKLTKELAEKNNSMPFYNEHFIPCANICYNIACLKNTDRIDAILIGIFHDVGKFLLTGKFDNHEIIGAKFTENFLRKNRYEEQKIQSIKQAIENHRNNANYVFDELSKQIINADIISYIIHKKYFYEYLLEFCTEEEASQTVYKKILESYERMDEDGKKLAFNMMIEKM